MRWVKLLPFVLFFVVLVVYLFPQSLSFPEVLPGSVQSMEQADTETDLRRAYFTNFSREEVIEHYKRQFASYPTIRLNYPPEDAQTLIRDQTRSYYLEELVHPFRESVYINGFIPQSEKDDIWYQGQHFYQKITIRYVPSNNFVRVTMALLITWFSYMVFLEWWKLLTEVRGKWK